jgi:gas vesicle protein
MSCIPYISNLVFSTLAGVVVGSLSTHLFAKARDKKNDEKKLRREMFGLLNAISFSLSTQYSQLYNLQKNLESRLAILGDEVKMRERNDRTVAIQDFVLDSSILVSFGSISELFGIVTNGFPGYQVNPGIFQSCYTSNKTYKEMQATL